MRKHDQPATKHDRARARKNVKVAKRELDAAEAAAVTRVAAARIKLGRALEVLRVEFPPRAKPGDTSWKDELKELGIEGSTAHDYRVRARNPPTRGPRKRRGKFLELGPSAQIQAVMKNAVIKLKDGVDAVDLTLLRKLARPCIPPAEVRVLADGYNDEQPHIAKVLRTLATKIDALRQRARDEIEMKRSAKG